MGNIKLENVNDILEFDEKTLCLVSFISKVANDQQFIDHMPEHPIFEIGYYDSKRRYKLISSDTSESIKVDVKENELTGIYKGVGGFDLDVICKVKTSNQDVDTKWNITVKNHCGLDIIDVHYPYIVCKYELAGTPDTETIILPHGYGSGMVITDGLRYRKDMTAHKLPADDWKKWEVTEKNGSCKIYPGVQFAQFMAYHNDRCGIYIACNDTDANVKRFQALHREPGVRLGISHIGDWLQQVERTLEYDVLIMSFKGDWYDAADIYRNWSREQEWFIPLFKKEIPKWLIDSPVFLTVRPAGILDYSYEMVNEFLPMKEKVIPLLENVAEKVCSALTVILMGWERAGSWVSPDSFPPVCGEEEMKAFISSLREHGWQGGTFSNGTRYCFEQCWSRYDGRDYLESIDAMEGVVREADGSYWEENWDNFRSAYLACIGSEKGYQMVVDFIKHLLSWGMESIQFFDQNNGGTVFACFAEDHDHPPAPGKWMHKKLRVLMKDLEKAANELCLDNVVHSAEAGLNEMCLPMFHQTELRIYPENYNNEIIPLYQYLFHECIALQGMMGFAPEPYHLVMLNAANCVLGAIPGGVLTGYGTLLDKDTVNWAVWEPIIEDHDNAFKMIKAVSALRRGAGKDFLLYGRMQKPALITGVKMISWAYKGQTNDIPAVFHNAWQSPSGGFGIVLANWTNEDQIIRVKDERLEKANKQLRIILSADELIEKNIEYISSGINIEIPSISCMLIEIEV